MLFRSSAPSSESSFTSKHVFLYFYFFFFEQRRSFFTAAGLFSWRLVLNASGISFDTWIQGAVKDKRWAAV